jgi:hypothetical protein
MKSNEKECLSASRRFQVQANKTCFNSKMSLLFEDIANTVKQYQKEIDKTRRYFRKSNSSLYFKTIKKSTISNNDPSTTLHRQPSMFNVTTNSKTKSLFKLTSPQNPLSNQQQLQSQQTGFTSIDKKTNSVLIQDKIQEFKTIQQESSNGIINNISGRNPSKEHSLLQLNLRDSNAGNKTGLTNANVSNLSLSHLSNSVSDVISRKKNYKVKYDKYWYKKNDFLPPNETAISTLQDKSYQRSLISNEIYILLESITNFKINYYEQIASEIHNHNITVPYVYKLNIILEETCALLMVISHMILFDFEKYLQNTEFVLPAYPQLMQHAQVVMNELAEFDTNMIIFNESTKFISNSFEIYLILSGQIEDYIISYHKMVKIKQFLSRARYSVSGLIFTSKSYIKDCISDKIAYNKYIFEITKRKGEVSLGKEDRKGVLKDMNDRLREKMKVKYTDEVEKNRRLNNALYGGKRRDREFEEKKRKVAKEMEKHVDLNSKMFNKLMMYMSKEKKNLILGEKLLQQFKQYKVKDKTKVLQSGAD